MPRGPGRRFAPGNNANPRGAGAHDPIKRMLRKITGRELEEVISHTLLTTTDQLKKEVEKDPSVVRTIIASSLLTGIKTGDLTPLRILIEMIHGRPKQRMEVAGFDGGPLEVTVETDEERQARKDRINQLIEMRIKLNEPG
ncbi:unnamed protein product [Sphagnum jensenii]|uniref:DUF5681 domain-containing protein n=1 Tax=Sphagnum jensenii TaxID=128206 RepID=A0ABP0V899_9BRYO